MLKLSLECVVAGLPGLNQQDARRISIMLALQRVAKGIGELRAADDPDRGNAALEYGPGRVVLQKSPLLKNGAYRMLCKIVLLREDSQSRGPTTRCRNPPYYARRACEQ
jgi:hypothetical protein